ncbi:MAG: RNA polymerase factor sigma-54 [Candidatus Aminicenantes bacterium]|nr:RNA polymerase factor sigma-54 [Candidatus Aminicenantes bacterium]
MRSGDITSGTDSGWNESSGEREDGATVLKQRLDQRQVQKLILAPALQQAIKLLPLTNLELIEVIDGELTQNPMLELEEFESAPEIKNRQVDLKTQAAATPAAGEAGEGPAGEAAAPAESGAEDLAAELSFQDYLEGGAGPYARDRKDIPSIENTLTKRASLWDHLNWQANLTFFDAAEHEVAQLVIGNINEDGYLTATIEEIAAMGKTDAETVERIRQDILFFDPVGAASFNLQEALLVQLDHLRVRDAVAREIIEKHLLLLEKSDYAGLTKALGLGLADVRAHIDVIKGLDPAPGRKYSQERTFYVVPDIIVSKEDDELKIALNDEGLPRLRISRYYRRLLAEAAKDSEAHEYLKDKMKKAIWFLRSLEQRDRTVARVARYIVAKQKEFFESGLDFIKPLTLMEIAREIGVHESTVGRVVANKHMMTPRGVFPLKYFFHKSLVGDFGEEVSSLRIKDRIRKLVENEDRTRPLSDDEIVAVLSKENLRIARRTVAKYRKQLRIPPSHIRKRKFLMEGAP